VVRFPQTRFFCGAHPEKRKACRINVRPVRQLQLRAYLLDIGQVYTRRSKESWAVIFCLSPEFPFRFQEENSIVRQQRQLYSLNRDEKEGVFIFSEKEIAAWKPKGKNEIRTGFSSRVVHRNAREPLVNRLKCKKNDGVSSRFMYSKYDVWRLTLEIFFSHGYWNEPNNERRKNTCDDILAV
jgi:hypothetical protein